MPYKNKTYTCVDGYKDIHYYYLMKAWKSSNQNYFNFFDAHDLNTARDSSIEATIKQRLSERMNNAKVLIVLVGESTKYLTKFVRWEMELAIKKELPIIAVNLNQHNGVDATRCPPTISNKLSLHVPFKLRAVEWAIDNWIGNHASLKSQRVNEPRVLSAELSRQLGI